MPVSDLPITYEFVCAVAGVHKIALGPLPQCRRMLKTPRSIALIGLITKPTQMQCGG
jgi:hypothetical protein